MFYVRIACSATCKLQVFTKLCQYVYAHRCLSRHLVDYKKLSFYWRWQSRRYVANLIVIMFSADYYISRIVRRYRETGLYRTEWQGKLNPNFTNYVTVWNIRAQLVHVCYFELRFWRIADDVISCVFTSQNTLFCIHISRFNVKQYYTYNRFKIRGHILYC